MLSRGKEWWNRLDARMIRVMARYGIPALRLALGVVFLWFGLLKVMGRSPVARLIAATVYWMSPSAFIPWLGVWEMVVGLGLLFTRALRVTLLLFWLQLAGTLFALVLRPDITFQGGNPLLLTAEGEFIVKNLVLIAGGIVVGGTVRHRST